MSTKFTRNKKPQKTPPVCHKQPPTPPPPLPPLPTDLYALIDGTAIVPPWNPPGFEATIDLTHQDDTPLYTGTTDSPLGTLALTINAETSPGTSTATLTYDTNQTGLVRIDFTFPTPPAEGYSTYPYTVQPPPQAIGVTMITIRTD